MNQVQQECLSSALIELRNMDYLEKKLLADEIRGNQPYLFDSIFELKEKMNIFVAKVEFILNIVLICCLALKKSGKNLPHITKKEIDDQTVHFLEIVGVENWFNNQSIEKMLNQVLGSNPEKIFASFAYCELIFWIYNDATLEKNDKYVMLVAASLVNAIEHVLSASSPQYLKPTGGPLE